MKACIEPKTHYSWAMINKNLSSDETEFELFGILIIMCGENQALLITCLVQSQQSHAGASIMLWGCFSAAGTGRLVAIEDKVNAAKDRDILEEDLVQNDLRLC